ncbi:LuxR C-terminal-related transcriptional regulator [Kitasatospora sp. NPDC049258]|uniref:LuxR C-terminal-related transcriptional regulator n=1 Tax=Kitasatospora sp. NPDC049258 TaxID=3155394 RepID=UPI0034472385
MPRSPDGMVERENQYIELNRIADGVRARGPAAVVIHGPWGVGKSALLASWAAGLRRAGWAELRVAGSGCPTGSESAAGPQAGWPDPTVRHLRAVPADPLGVPGTSAAPAAGRPAPGELLARAAGVARTAPALLAVDDIGPDDACWLARLVRRLDGAGGPLLLAVLLESGAPGPAGRLDHTLEDLLDAGAHSVPVRPLSLRGTTQLLTSYPSVAAIPLAEVAGAVHSATGGTPLLVRRLARRLGREDGSHRPGADRIHTLAATERRRAVVARLEQRGGTLLDTAVAAAVLGRRSSCEDITALAGADPATTREQIAALTAAGVLERGRDGAVLCREATGEALLRTLPTAARTELHARAATVLFEAGAAAEAIAEQLCATPPGGPPWAIRVLLDAADRAGLRAVDGAVDGSVDEEANEEVLRLLRRALAEAGETPARAAVLRRLAEFETPTSPTSAVRRLREVVRLTGTARPDGADRTAELLSRALRRSGRPLEAAGTALSALGALRGAGAERDGREATAAARSEVADVLEEQWTLAALADTGALSGAPDERQGGAVVDPVTLVRSAPSRALWSALGAHPGRPADELGSPGCAAYGRRESPAGRDARGPEHVQVRAWAALLGDRLQPCGALTCDCSERWPGPGSGSAGAARGDREQRVFRYGWRAHAALWHGALDEAGALAQRALELQDGRAPAAPWPSPIAAAAAVELERGRPAAAALLLERAEPAPRSLDGAVLMVLTGRLHLATGDHCAALEILLRCGRELGRAGIHHPVLVPWRRTAALAWAALGRAEPARELLREEARSAYRLGTPRALGLNRRAWGAVTDGEERRWHLRMAVTHLGRSPARLDLARALADLAEAEALLGDPAAAAAAARRARELGLACGAEQVVARAGAAITAGPLGPQPSARLTKAQQRVVELAAAGLSNRQIAGRLYVTLRTVEIHLTQAYRRLGIRGRAELPSALAGVAQPPAGPGSAASGSAASGSAAPGSAPVTGTSAAEATR